MKNSDGVIKPKDQMLTKPVKLETSQSFSDVMGESEKEKLKKPTSSKSFRL